MPAPQEHGRGTAACRSSALWKMLDNLRRSLSAPASVAALLAGWTLPAAAALPWCAFILLALALPTLLPVFAAHPAAPLDGHLRSHLRALRNDFVLALAQTGAAHQHAGLPGLADGDAIGRTLWRMFVSHRHLLEWIPADLLGSMRDSLRRLLPAHVPRRGATLALAALTVYFDGGTLPALALPFLLLWLAAPAIAWRISRTPPAAARSELIAAQQRELRLIARRTWRFFETFVTRRRQPPAAGQFPGRSERRWWRTAPRPPTSVSICCRRSRRAISAGAACATRSTASRRRSARWSRMQKHRGHLYNWYDTRDLRPLDPRYVSSVDSGNLAAHLITLAGAFREWQKDAGAAPRRPSTASPTRSTWRARRCAHSASSPGLTITRELLETAFDDLEAALRPRDRARSIRRLDDAARRGRARLDAGRHGAHAGQRDAASSATPTWSTGSKPRGAPSTAGAATCWRAIRPASSSSTWRHWPTTALAARRRHGIRLPARHAAQAAVDRLSRHRRHARRAATTCWPPRRGSRASSPSPRATFRRGTGSGSAARSRRSAPARRWCPGPARCSST